MSTPNNDYYKMDHKSRGYAVIINNYKFKKRESTEEFQLKEHKPLEAQKYDVEIYIETFKMIGFEENQIKVCENLAADKMKEIMKDYATIKDYTDCDCFIAVFLSHGYLSPTNKQFIVAADSEGVEFHENLTDIFRGTKSLFDKPKIFFVDACRGNKEELGCSKSINKSLLFNEETNEKYILFLRFIFINLYLI